jgi:hypothetical protein
VFKLAFGLTRNHEVALLLSVLIPISLFAVFKISGLAGGPLAIAETTTLDTITWNRERPYLYPNIPGPYTVNASYVTDDIALSFGFELNTYVGGPSSERLQGPSLRPLNASVPNGFIVSVELTFKEAYPTSHASFEWDGNYENLTLHKVLGGSDNFAVLGTKSVKAYLKASAIGQPRGVYMAWQGVAYFLCSQYNQTHHIMIETAVTYFNGTVYKRLVQPVELVYGPDHNNSFEAAEEIGFGQRTAYIDNDVNGDPVDYYKIWLHDRQTVQVSSLVEGGGVVFGPSMFIYDPEKNVEVCWGYRQNETLSQITLNINQTDWWYIKVTGEEIGGGIYVLDVSPVQG